MSLFGALSSGVSGLSAQSSAMGAIGDNITNVSTIGYKNTQVDFQTLVTKQTSSTLFSPGGVQSKPRQDTGVQGLLQASSSQSDLSISGNGFFVINETAKPGVNDQFLFTRAGSFFQDNAGFLRNTAGFYLQGWPTDAAGVVVPANKTLSVANQNIVSTDFLETINLSRVGGTASATSTISVGANLPSNDAAGTIHRTDVQFFDTLGNSSNLSFAYTKSVVNNQWGLAVNPPAGSTVLTIEDSSARVYDSVGQLEFTARPADGSTVVIDSITYEFDSNNSVTNPVAQVNSVTIAGANSDGLEQYRVTINGTNIDTTITPAGQTPTQMAASIATSINNNATVNGLVTASASAGVISVTSDISGTSFTIAVSELADPAAGNTTIATAVVTANAGSSTRIKVDISSSTTVAGDVQALVNAVTTSARADTDFVGNGRMAIKSGDTSTILFNEDGTGAIVVNPVGLRDSSGSPITKQTSAFTVKKLHDNYTPSTQFKFTNVPADTQTLTINGITYTFTAAETSNDNDLNIRIDNVANMLADLEASIEANDPEFAAGASTVSIAERGGMGATVEANTLSLSSLAKGSYSVVFGGTFSNPPTSPDATTTYAAAQTVTIQTVSALTFDSSGLPSTFSVSSLEILGFANGAADMDGASANSPQIALDFGTVKEANGMTQFGASFTPVFITQNGSRFGTFSGVSVANSGLVTALFDNGETRPIFQIPVATFVNVNGLESKTGNVWNATEGSGDVTLRVADNGPAGQVVQGALEASTVDIGTEFTKMIVVQRAFSAAAKIISTTDDMLEELLRVKR